MSATPDRAPSPRPSGFHAAALAKTRQVLDLLHTLCGHPDLQGKFCLKGGTALHLFILDLLRLSEDIDLNYIGSAALAGMQAERPHLEAVLQKLFRAAGLILVRGPQGRHTGGKWSLQDPHLAVGDRHLSVDILFGYRVPLWNPATAACKLPGHTHVANIPVLDIHDLAGGKLAALLSRRKARDVFDACALFALPPGNLDPMRLRTAFVVHGAMHRLDWRTRSLNHVDCDPQELVHNLWPMLPLDTRPDRTTAHDYARQLTTAARAGLSAVLPFTLEEREFLDCLLDRGEIVPDLLTADPDLQARIAAQPMLAWKAQHVRRYKRRSSATGFPAGCGA